MTFEFLPSHGQKKVFKDGKFLGWVAPYHMARGGSGGDRDKWVWTSADQGTHDIFTKWPTKEAAAHAMAKALNGMSVQKTGAENEG